MIEAEWEYLQQKKPPRDIFTFFPHYFQLNLHKTSFLCNEDDLNFIGLDDKPRHAKNCIDLRFTITVHWVVIVVVVNSPV